MIRPMELKELRDRLDVIDKELEEQFAARMQVVRAIGEYKKRCGIATFDAAREAQVLAMHTDGQSEEIKPYMEEFFKAVMDISKEYQDSGSKDL